MKISKAFSKITVLYITDFEEIETEEWKEKIAKSKKEYKPAIEKWVEMIKTMKNSSTATDPTMDEEK